jgi:hypothetical protein
MYKLIFYFILVILIAPTFSCSKFEKVFYVSPEGNDSNTGKISKPFKTIQRALDELGRIKNANSKLNNDFHIILRGGTYFIDSALVFNSQLSSNTQHSVFIEAYENETPVISGGRVIIGWERHDNQRNIWIAASNGIKSRQLYINCNRAVRSRSKAGLSGKIERTATGYFTDNSNLAGWNNQDGIEFVYNAVLGGTGGSQWTERRVPVASITDQNGRSTIEMKQPAFSLCCLGGNQGVTFPTHIENAFELLDEPGEWYLDGRKKQVYYIPKAGEDLSTAIVIAPVAQSLLNVSGTVENPVRNLVLRGLTFVHTTWLRPGSEMGFPEIQANFMAKDSTYTQSCDRIPGAINLEHANHITIESCNFSHLGGAGLDIYNGCQQIEIRANHFEDISGTGIQIGTVTDAIRPDLRLRDSSIVIVNNYIDNVTQEYRGGCAIAATYCSLLNIHHNEIGPCNYTAVSIGWGWGENAVSFAHSNKVSYNNIHHYAGALTDQGAVYMLGQQPDSEVSYNYIHHQLFKILGPGGAIYPDQGSRYWELHHNVIDSTGNWVFLWHPDCRDISVRNNYSNQFRCLNKGTRIIWQNNTDTIKGNNWPKEAIEIIKNAGPESEFAGIRKKHGLCVKHQIGQLGL